MRRAIPLALLAALVCADLPPPLPEECAAMLLSPDAERRAAGLRLIDDAAYARDVLRAVARRGHDIPRWLADLAAEAATARGDDLLRIERTRDALIGGEGVNIGVDFYAVSVAHAFAEALLGERRGQLVGEEGGAWVRLWDRIVDEATSETLGWIAVTGRERCPAEARVQRRISYVSELRVGEGGIVDPAIGSLTVGATMRWIPVLSADRNFLTLDCDLVVSDIVRPIAVREVAVGASKGQVQQPELHAATARRTLTIPKGGYAVLGLPAEKATTLILLQAVVGAPRCEPPPSRPAR